MTKDEFISKNFIGPPSPTYLAIIERCWEAAQKEQQSTDEGAEDCGVSTVCKDCATLTGVEEINNWKDEQNEKENR